MAWDEAYAVLVEIVRDGRSRDNNYAAELYQLDEQTDYRYDRRYGFNLCQNCRRGF